MPDPEVAPDVTQVPDIVVVAEKLAPVEGRSVGIGSDGLEVNVPIGEIGPFRISGGGGTDGTSLSGYFRAVADLPGNMNFVMEGRGRAGLSGEWDKQAFVGVALPPVSIGGAPVQPVLGVDEGGGFKAKVSFGF